MTTTKTICKVLEFWERKEWSISDIEQAKKEGEELRVKFWYENKAVECKKHDWGYAIINQ